MPKPRLDLACGAKPADGYEGVDQADLGQPFIVDLEQRPWPWPDDSVAALRASHIVEHLVDLVGFMNECYRILEPGGELLILCPYQFSVGAWQDPTHVRALNECSWDYYNAFWRHAQGLDHYPITTDFTVKSIEPSLVTEAFKEIPADESEWARAHNVNVVHEITVVLLK